MTSYKLLLVIFTFLFATAFSCQTSDKSKENESKTPRIRKESKLTSPKMNKKMVIGEPIVFEFKSDEEIDSIVLEYGNERAVYETTLFEWKPDRPKTGIVKAQVTVHMGEESETHYPRVQYLADQRPEEYTYKIVKKYPHSDESYVQGLFFEGNTLYESTGQKGRSSLMKVELSTGKILEAVNLNEKYFGEGSTSWKDQIVWLTWTSGEGFVYNLDLQQKGTFRYEGEGWGITTYGDTLIRSDGTEVLHFLNPRDFSKFSTLQVFDNKGPVKKLNELEMIDGLIYANIYEEDDIVAIDPITGKVVRRISFEGLLSPEDRVGRDVLNGIAYHKPTGKIYVTGKWWPYLFEVTFVPLNQ